jgi:hypothetical protein
MPKLKKKLPKSPPPCEEAEQTAGLCHRCEHRIRNIEDKYLRKPHAHQPRCECGESGHVRDDEDGKPTAAPGGSKHSCYMYSPVRPLVMVRDMADDRPMFAGSLLSCRSHAARIADELDVCKAVHKPDLKKEEYLAYWRPKYPHWRGRIIVPDVIVEKKTSPCPRCGKVHRKLIYRMLVKPVLPWAAAPSMGDYDCWATCPNTGEPIIGASKTIEAVE